MGSDPLPLLSFATRRELLERAALFYREASLAQKGLLLDHVMAMTGNTRKYAIRLLNHLCESKRRITRQRLPRYGSEVRQEMIQGAQMRLQPNLNLLAFTCFLHAV